MMSFVTLTELIDAPEAQSIDIRPFEPLDAFGQFLGKKVTVEADFGQYSLAIFQHFHRR